MTIKQLLTGTLGLCILGVASLVVTVAPSGAQEAGSSAEGPSVEPLRADRKRRRRRRRCSGNLAGHTVCL